MLVLGIDVRDLFTGRLSWRRLDNIIGHLPPESATKTAMRESLTDEQLSQLAGDGPVEHGQWSRLEWLVATLIDQVKALRYLTLAINTKEPGDPPEPYPRPGVPRAAVANQAAVAAGREHLERLRARRHLELVKEA